MKHIGHEKNKWQRTQRLKDLLKLLWRVRPMSALITTPHGMGLGSKLAKQLHAQCDCCDVLATIANAAVGGTEASASKALVTTRISHANSAVLPGPGPSHQGGVVCRQAGKGGQHDCVEAIHAGIVGHRLLKVAVTQACVTAAAACMAASVDTRPVSQQCRGA